VVLLRGIGNDGKRSRSKSSCRRGMLICGIGIGKYAAVSV
jgi:hypothetical protein